MIRDAVKGDSEAIAHIYNHYIENTAISFEEKPVRGADIQGRIEAVQGQVCLGWWQWKMVPWSATPTRQNGRREAPIDFQSKPASIFPIRC